MKNTEHKEQIKRICQMERSLDRVASALNHLDEALHEFDAVQPDIDILEAYYSSGEWRCDFEADEAGQLPKQLKRGVLSEDALWNLLADCKELSRRLNNGD